MTMATEMDESHKAPPDWIAIMPMRMQFLDSYRECLGSVARERKFLMLTDAPSLESVREFVQHMLETDSPIYVALLPGIKIAGWCDVTTSQFETRAHVGTLGMGVLKEYRGQGIGRLLMERALKHARRIMLERIELEVFSTNTPAIQLYKSFGFEVEGIKRRARKFGDEYIDSFILAKHL